MHSLRSHTQVMMYQGSKELLLLFGFRPDVSYSIYSRISLIKSLRCHRKVLRHFRFNPFLTEKPFKFGVNTINRNIRSVSEGFE